MKKILIIPVIAILLLPIVVLAAVRQDQNFSLGRSDVISKNLYGGGGSVSILGEAKKDVVVAGGTINISGNVGQDLAAAGGNLTIDGNIADDVRIAGGNLSVGGNIGGELMAAGGQISLNQGAQVKGDASLAGGNISIEGVIGGDLTVFGGTIRIDGKVAGNVKVKTDQKLVIGSSAEISGNLDYSSPEQLTRETGAVIKGKVIFSEYKAPAAPRNLFGIWGVSWLIGLAISLTAALAVFFLFRKKVEEAVSYALSNFGKETLRGFIILVVLPIAAVISFITVIGVLLGVAGLMLYALVAVFGSIFAAIVLGTLLFRLILKKPEFIADWRSVVTGVLVMSIIKVIPYVGWIFCLIFFLAAFGTLFNYLYRSFRKA